MSADWCNGGGDARIIQEERRRNWGAERAPRKGLLVTLYLAQAAFEIVRSREKQLRSCRNRLKSS